MTVEEKVTILYHWKIRRHVICEGKRASFLRVDWHRPVELLFYDQL
jgi:hypothetical protein